MPDPSANRSVPIWTDQVDELFEFTDERAGRAHVLALDLERTLIDNALSGRPRPGLRKFLAFCHERFTRVAIFTAVEEADAREVLADLDRAGHLPSGLLDRLEFVGWSGEFKDLTFIPGAVPTDALLVDDDAGWVRPDQRPQWVPIAAWDGGPDDELPRVKAVLELRLADLSHE